LVSATGYTPPKRFLVYADLLGQISPANEREVFGRAFVVDGFLVRCRKEEEQPGVRALYFTPMGEDDTVAGIIECNSDLIPSGTYRFRPARC
jgi:hypothetical protein